MSIIIICVIVVVLIWFFKPKTKGQTNSNSNNSSYNTTPKESSWDKVIRYHNSFISYLENKGVACTDISDSGQIESMVFLPFSGKNLKEFNVLVDFGLMVADHKVSIMGWDFVHFSSDKRDAIIAACNECNTDPKVRFISGDDNVRTLMDAYVNDDSWCEQCEALARQMADIVDRNYPVFAKALRS